MMPSSRPRDSTRSPITKVPYDVLREILSHCLPRRPLETQPAHWQPNTTIAPMLLCQICSSWRTITLASPSLWSHLLYRISAHYTDHKLGSWAVRQKDIDFVMWWKTNQGSMAPFLHLDIDIKRKTWKIPLAKDGIAFLIEYITSAQYLQIHPRLSEQIHDKLAVKNMVIFPDLHTLVTYQHDAYLHHTQVLVGLMSTHTSLLRRLALNGGFLLPGHIIPNHWSTLTHLSMHKMVISLPSWYSFIRGLPGLQWADIQFEFDLVDDEYDGDDYTKPPAEYTHLQLSTLLITCGDFGIQYVALPFAALFTSLYLPALQMLSLSSLVDSWEDHHTISELHTVLQCTPTLTTLALRGYGHGFLSLHKPDYPTILSAIGDVEPIWTHAPHFEHLQLDLPRGHDYDVTGRKIDTFVRNFFLPNSGWLALDNLTCPIQTVSFICSRHLNLDTIRELTMASIPTEGVSITIKITSGTEDDTDAWMEWGSRNC
jgi:hypothetical protein